jgi:hypothetical protein
VAIKAGSLIHIANQVLVHRAQTAGPGTVTINRNKIYELGNYNSVGTDDDLPDLSFSLESFDTTAEIEALLTGAIPPTAGGAATAYGALAAGTGFKLAKAVPQDVASVFKPGQTANKAGVPGGGAYDTIGSVAMPYLTLESFSYNFGLADSASQTATLRGDTLLYTPGSTYIEVFANPASITLAHPAFPYNGDTVAGTRYALTVTTSKGERLSFGPDYTEAVTGTNASGTRTVAITLSTAQLAKLGTGDWVRVVYASDDPVAVYPQASHAKTVDTDATHPAPRPAAIRGRNIEFFVYDPTTGHKISVTDRWNSVQSVTVDYRVSLERDEEFGNSSIVAQDFDVPDVSGTVEIKPRDYTELYNRVAQIAGVPAGEVVGPLTTKPLGVDIVLHNPNITPTEIKAGVSNVLKTIRIPDARFSFPGFQGRVQQKMTVSMDYTSDSGDLTIYKGVAPDFS